MSIIQTNPIFNAVSGKLSKTERIYLRTNKVTGRTYAIARRDRPAAPATEQQLQNRRRFALLSRAVKEWFAANRPGRESPSSPGTIEYYNLHNLYLQQNKVGSFPAFVFRHVAAQYDETCQPTE